MTVGAIEAFCSGGARQHAKTLHGIVPGLFIVRVGPFRRPLGTCHQQLYRHRDIVTGKQSTESYLLFVFTKSTLMALLKSSAHLGKRKTVHARPNRHNAGGNGRALAFALRAYVPSLHYWGVTVLEPDQTRPSALGACAFSPPVLPTRNIISTNKPSQVLKSQ
jgi:hypothetical protein